MSPEEKFIISACSLSLSDDKVDLLRALANDIKDWDTVNLMAQNHRVASFLYYSLKKADLLNTIPTEIAKKWHAVYLSNYLQNESAFSEIRQLAQTVKGEKVVLLKGAALNLMLYPDLGIRPMSDIDVLVEKNRRYEIYKILGEQGWNVGNTTEKSEIHSKISDVEHKHLPKTNRTENGKYVELHWKFFAGTNDDEISAEAVKTSVKWEENVYLMSNEMMFAHLCSNFTDGYDLGETLRTLCDVNEFLLQKELDWSLLDRICKEEPLHSRLLTALNCVAWMFGTKIPTKYVTNEFEGVEVSLDFLASDKIADRTIGFKRFITDAVKKCDTKTEVFLLFYKTIFPSMEWLKINFRGSKFPLLSYWFGMVQKKIKMIKGVN